MSSVLLKDRYGKVKGYANVDKLMVKSFKGNFNEYIEGIESPETSDVILKTGKEASLFYEDISHIILEGLDGRNVTYTLNKLGPTVLTFHITSSLDQPLYFTQSDSDAVVIDWGDGSPSESFSDLSVSTSHHYPSSGDYEVKMVCSEGKVWCPGVAAGVSVYSLLGLVSGKSTNTYPSLVTFKFGDGCTLNSSRSALEYCTGLTSIEISNKTTEVPSSTFSGCTSLQSVVVPYTVTSIASNAFSGCTALDSLIIDMPIVGDAFKLSTLTSVVFGTHVLEINASAFEKCGSLVQVTFSDSLVAIRASAFKGCTNLSEVVLPGSLKEIGQSAFESCTTLTEITIPESVTDIGYYAFRYCNHLETVNINMSGDLSAGIFEDLSALKTVNIGNRVTGVSRGAFDGSDNIEIVSIDMTVVPSSVFGTDESQELHPRKIKILTMGSHVTGIDSYAFNRCTLLNSVELNEGLVYIERYSFQTCQSLQSIVIPNSVTSLGEGAFYHCTLLESVVLSNNLTSIPFRAFSSCTSLSSISIPNSVTSIDDYAFYNCTSLSSFTCLPTIPPTIQLNTFNDVPSTMNIYVPSASVDAYKSAQYWSNRADYIFAIE